MDSVLDLLFLRRPKLEYTCPPVCDFFPPSSGSGSGMVIVVNPVGHHSAPTGLTAGPCSISWGAYEVKCSGSAALCFAVYRSDTENGDYAATESCIEGTHADLSLSGFYRVSAITLDGESDLSAPVYVSCGSTPPGDPVATLNIGSTTGNIIVEWESTPTPDNYEVWRSQNGGAFSLLGTVSGATVLLSDVDGIASTDIWCYKVKAIKDGIESNFSNEVCAVRDMIYPSIGAVSHPTWVLAFGDFGADDSTQQTTVDFSGLKAVIGGTLGFDASLIMTSINLDSLISVSGNLFFSASFELPSISLSSLTHVGASLYCDSCFLLTSVSIPVLMMLNGKGYFFDSSALDVASVNHVLARGVASGITTATITLDGGTNAAPAGQGVIDKAALITVGNTVTSN